MNNKRRELIKQIAIELDALRERVENIKSEEQDYFDNMPESLQNGEKGETAQAAIDALDTAYDGFDTIVDALSEADGQ